MNHEGGLSFEDSNDATLESWLLDSAIKLCQVELGSDPKRGNVEDTKAEGHRPWKLKLPFGFLEQIGNLFRPWVG